MKTRLDSGQSYPCTYGVWINKAQSWACEPSTFKPRRFDTRENARAFLTAAGFVDSTNAAVHLSAYVAEAPPIRQQLNPPLVGPRDYR